MTTAAAYTYYNKRNSPEYDEAPYVGLPKKLVVLASTPRVGSTVLSRGLSDLGLLPACEEYFQDMNMTDYLARWGDLTKTEYLQMLYAHRTSAAGVFGVKAHFNQIEPFLGDMPAPGNCAFIFMERKNKIMQAVSFYIAYKSGKWHLPAKSGQQTIECEYDFLRIYAFLVDIIDQNNAWIDFFKKHSIQPKPIVSG